MESPPDIAIRLQAILDDDRLDDDAVEETRAEVIEAIIEAEGWEPVQRCLIDVMKNDLAPRRDWISAAEVFWEAALDGRKVEADLIIFLLYKRLKPDSDYLEENLIWSIASKLKRVGYLSEYEPMQDPAVLAAGRAMGATDPPQYPPQAAH